MSVIIGVGVAASIGTVWLLRKGWLVFHDMAGITRVMRYEPVAQLPYEPQLILLQVDNSRLKYLPDAQKQKIQRIDDKADVYQEWRDDIQKRLQESHSQSAQKPRQVPTQVPMSETQFVVAKLLREHLPEALDSYHAIAKRQQRVQTRSSMSVQNQSQSLSVLDELLDDIETRLDGLLEECEAHHLQEMTVIKRYLHSRNDTL